MTSVYRGKAIMGHRVSQTGAVLCALLLSATTALAEDRRWPLIGMTGAEATALLAGKCLTTWNPPPYLTCVDGRDVITATFSDKDRLHYLQRIESTTMTNADYAALVAAELGFDGPPVRCARYDTPAFCWTRADGTQLFAAMDFDAGLLASQLMNEGIEAEDTTP